MHVLVNFTNPNEDEIGKRIYRSTSPMLIDALPEPLAEISKHPDSYVDIDVEFETTYYYRVSSYDATEEVVSEEMSVTTPEAPSYEYQASLEALNPKYYWKLRYFNEDDYVQFPFASGFASIGQIEGAVLSLAPGSGWGPVEALVNDLESCPNISIQSASQSPGWRIYYADGYPASEMNNNGNCIKGSTNFTISMWIKATGPNNTNPTNKWNIGTTTLIRQTMINGGQNYLLNIRYNITTQKILFQIAKATDIGQQDLSFYQGHHLELDLANLGNGDIYNLVFTRGAGDKLSIYVNGSLLGSTTYGGTSFPLESQYSYLSGLGVSYNAMVLDELAIFYSELSAGQVSTLYAQATS